MEFDDWGPVFSRVEHDHFNNKVTVAKAFSIALVGDDIDWQQHMTNASRFIEAMNKTMPKVIIA